VQIRKQWRDKEIFSKGKPRNDKRMLDKNVDGEIKRNDLWIIFGRKIDNNKNNKK
jgi:hypothetical protein